MLSFGSNFGLKAVAVDCGEMKLPGETMPELSSIGLDSESSDSVFT
jgi:hypothetical protein